MNQQNHHEPRSQSRAESSHGDRLLCGLVRVLRLPSTLVPAAFHGGDSETERQPGADKIHRERYTLLRNRLFSIELHRITGQAIEQFHNHPWSALSIVLTGSYRERFFDADLQQRERKVRWLNRVRPSRFHMMLDAKPNTWLLLIAGRQQQGRGFIASLGDDQASYVVPAPFDFDEDAGCEPGQHVI